MRIITIIIPTHFTYLIIAKKSVKKSVPSTSILDIRSSIPTIRSINPNLEEMSLEERNHYTLKSYSLYIHKTIRATNTYGTILSPYELTPEE